MVPVTAAMDEGMPTNGTLFPTHTQQGCFVALYQKASGKRSSFMSRSDCKESFSDAWTCNTIPRKHQKEFLLASHHTERLLEETTFATTQQKQELKVHHTSKGVYTQTTLWPKSSYLLVRPHLLLPPECASPLLPNGKSSSEPISK